MTFLYEIQASHIGIGKSTFVQNLNLQTIDDCLQLAESFGEDWYKEGNSILSWLKPNEDDILRAYLILENYASKIDFLSPTKDLVSSRSPLVSVLQFMPNPLFKYQRDTLVQYYEKRLKHAGIDKVFILDYGSSIAENFSCVRLGYIRMIRRGRPFELAMFNSFEKYLRFFDICEKRKEDIVRDLQQNSFFNYKNVEFNTFDDTDLCAVKQFITTNRLK